MDKPKEEKIVMTLGVDGEEKKMYNQPHLPFEEKDEYAPVLNVPEEIPIVIDLEVNEKKKEERLSFELEMPEIKKEEQKRRAEERINKLRNLSYNMNTMDTENEYENVPAYVRRNLELFGNNKLTTVEDFYSKVAVKKDENNHTQISTINTFLDGKKP